MSVARNVVRQMYGHWNGTCVIDYRKLITRHGRSFQLPFIDQMLERLAGHEYYCFLDGFSGYFQIPISLEDQEKTTFTCPYRTFTYKRMPFGLCNAPATFQHCMTAIFHELIEDSMEVFMEDFSVFVIVPVSNLIEALAVVKNGVPKMKGVNVRKLSNESPESVSAGFSSIEILHDVVGTSGYHCGVLAVLTDGKIKQWNRVVRLEDGIVVPYGELNGIPVALVARFGVVSKSTDRILVSHGG
ncbi:reverse transcriptase domain-containing protein [Tanacetum coccineum]